MRTSNNPALTRSPVFGSGQRIQTAEQRTPPADPLEEAYFGPSATSKHTGRMTVEDVVSHTALLLAIAFGTGAVTWATGLGGLALPAALVGFGLAMVIIFRQVTNPAVIMAYAAVEGIFLGGISQAFNAAYPGIVVQAVAGTAGVTAVMLGLYRSGRIRVTPRFTKMVVGATIGFVVLIMVNLLAGLFVDGGLGLRQGPLGIVFGLFAIGLASMNLVLDFDMVEKGARQGAPARFAWFAAFGILVTMVWLYIEMLRLLSILRGRN